MNQPQKKRNNDQYRDIAKYSNIALKMLIIIGGSIMAGVYADARMGWRIPVFTLIASLASVAIAIYITIKDLLK